MVSSQTRGVQERLRPCEGRDCTGTCYTRARGPLTEIHSGAVRARRRRGPNPTRALLGGPVAGLVVRLGPARTQRAWRPGASAGGQPAAADAGRRAHARRRRR